MASMVQNPPVQYLGSTQEGCPRPIIGQHSLNYKVVCVVYYSLQGYTGLIIRNAFAQQYTDIDTLDYAQCA